jgi:hypothetical protein
MTLVTAFSVNDIVFIRDDFKTAPADAMGFRVICNTPDHSGTIPVQRLDDDEYACLPVEALETRDRKIKGRFWKRVDGATFFAVEDPIKAANYGFIGQGQSTSPRAIRGFDYFITDTVEINIQ